VAREASVSAIVHRVREEGPAGATVVRGNRKTRSKQPFPPPGILRLSEDWPLVIEVVDSEKKVNAMLPILDEMIAEVSSPSRGSTW